MANVTSKSNKETIWEAYQSALKTIEALKAGKMDPLAEREVKRVEAVLTAAEKIAAEDVVNPSVIAEYNTLKEAIELKKTEIKELTGIEDAVLNLVALVNAHGDIERKFNEEMAARKAEKQAELDELNKEIRDNWTNYKTEEATYLADLKKAREREKAEYEYNKSRERKLADDKWADEKALRLKELTEKENGLDARIDAVFDREAKMDELEAKIEEIPALVAEAKEAGIKEGKAKADTSNAFEVKAIKASAEADAKLAAAEIKMLRETIARLEKENAEFKTANKEAVDQVKAIATSAVEAAGNTRMVSQMQDFASSVTKTGK